MKHQLSHCQVLSTEKNTPSFWDFNLENNEDKIFASPIYIKKNNLVLKQLRLIKGKMLDVGLGYGYIERLIVKNKLDLELYGIDISKYAVRKAKSKFSGKFDVSSIYKIPYGNRYFDCVLALDILEHLPAHRINKALMELRRVMKKTSILVVSIPLNESLADRLRNRHLRVYTEDILRMELTKNGFKIIGKHNLTAFKSLFQIKNLINRIFNIKRPNLLILICQKQ